MGIVEAKKYIYELHRKQDNPFLWPDYLTGLHDKAAIIKKLQEIYPKLGRYSIAYIRIANIHPYLIKYGANKHAEIIQWSAAILKTTCESCKNCFVGTLNTHDFIIMCETKDIIKHIKQAVKLFSKKIESYYEKGDLINRTTLSFKKDGGKKITIGLMKFISVIADRKLNIKKGNLIQSMGMACDEMEGNEEDIIIMSNEMASIN